MKFSTHPACKVDFFSGMKPATMSGIVIWNIANSDQRKKDTNFNYDCYPGIAFCVPTEEDFKSGLHLKSLQKLF